MPITVPYNWKPRNYQMPLWEFFEDGGKRGVAVWHRRAGKDLFAINWIATAAVQRTGLYWHLLPTYNQGRKIVWEGFTKDGRKFLDHFPEDLVASKNNTDMRLTLTTGSIYQVVGTDDADRLVGTNPIGCVFSEYSLQDPAAWNIIRPILAENEGWALFIYTARGRNHGYTMVNMAKKNKTWFDSVLVAGDRGTLKEDGTPVISDAVIQEEREANMPEELIQQEFHCSFDAPIVGAYYGKQMMQAAEDARILHIPWEPRIPVDTCWDLGIGDAMSIWFVQQSGMETRLIDYYENSGEGLAHYAKILKEKDYIYGDHYAPHDIEVRELGTGKSRREVARSMGIRFRVVPQHDLMDGIEAVRNFLPQCWFEVDKCERGIEGLRQYRKEYDEKRKTFGDRPVHDWASHPADSLRYFVMGHRKRRNRNAAAPQQQAVTEYDIMSA